MFIAATLNSILESHPLYKYFRRLALRVRCYGTKDGGNRRTTCDCRVEFVTSFTQEGAMKSVSEAMHLDESIGSLVDVKTARGWRLELMRRRGVLLLAERILTKTCNI